MAKAMNKNEKDMVEMKWFYREQFWKRLLIAHYFGCICAQECIKRRRLEVCRRRE